MADPIWKGLFDWSMQYQDGTQEAVRQPMDENKRKWLEEALDHLSQDLAKRMKEIKTTLDDDGEASVDEQERLLDELCEIVEDINFARDLAVVGGLPTLLRLLECQHPVLRAKAAEVVATAVQNNPPVQQWFMEGGVLPPLIALLHNTDSLCRTKALLAMSAMVRHNADALDAFLSKGGLQELIDIIKDDDLRNQRKALQLLGYVTRERSSAANEAVNRYGVLQFMGAGLLSKDRTVQGAALDLMSDLAHHPEPLVTMKQDTELQAKLTEAQARLGGSDRRCRRGSC
eukprot:jgi/Botrbrau1/4603/Bobra.60_2s0088.1